MFGGAAVGKTVVVMELIHAMPRYCDLQFSPLRSKVANFCGRL
jgi:F0F1-type ATP synthase beta subunit